MKSPEKKLIPIQKSHAINKYIFTHTVLSGYFLIAHKRQQSRSAAITEDKSLQEEFYSNDSLGG